MTVPRARIGRKFIQELVDRTNAVGADIVVLTGDFVDGSVDELRDGFAPFAQLRAAGYWGPPVLVGAPPEITKVILRSATGEHRG